MAFLGNASKLLFKHFEFSKPIVVRLKGSGNELGITKLKEIGYEKLYFTDDFDGAVRMAVDLAAK